MITPEDLKLRQRNAAIPDDTAAAMRRLHDAHAYADLDVLMLALHESGWTLDAIATPISITRERVRQRLLRFAEMAPESLPVVPLPPLKPPKPPKPQKPAPPGIPPEIEERMREIAPTAKLARAGMRHPERQAMSRELSEIMFALLQQGVPQITIARAAGLSNAAVMLRVRRFGYLPLYDSQPHVVDYATRHKDVCKRGHPMSGSNLRITGGTGPSAGSRACRNCQHD